MKSTRGATVISSLSSLSQVVVANSLRLEINAFARYDHAMRHRVEAHPCSRSQSSLWERNRSLQVTNPVSVNYAPIKTLQPVKFMDSRSQIYIGTGYSGMTNIKTSLSSSTPIGDLLFLTRYIALATLLMINWQRELHTLAFHSESYGTSSRVIFLYLKNTK